MMRYKVYRYTITKDIRYFGNWLVTGSEYIDTITLKDEISDDTLREVVGKLFSISDIDAFTFYGDKYFVDIEYRDIPLGSLSRYLG